MIERQQPWSFAVMREQSTQEGEHLQCALARQRAVKDFTRLNVNRPEARPLLILRWREQTPLLADELPHSPQHGEETAVGLILYDYRFLTTHLRDAPPELLVDLITARVCAARLSGA